MYHHVALLTPPYTSLTYARPAWLPAACWRAGMRALVPLGGGACRMGVLLDNGQADSGLPDGTRVRPMLWPLEAAPLLSAEYLELVRQLALRQLEYPGRILGTVLPAGLRESRARLRVEGSDHSASAPRQVSVRQLWDLARAAQATTPTTQKNPANSASLATPASQENLASQELAQIGQAWCAGRARWLLPREDAAGSEVCVLLKDPPWALRAGAVRQMRLLEYLLEHGAVSRRQLLRGFADAAVPLAGLVRHGLVGIRVRDWADGDEQDAGQEHLVAPAVTEPLEPSSAQQQALDAFAAVMATGKPASHLLYGVTGSGKTLVYIRLAAACLAAGRSVLLLAPEVALAMKLRRDVRAALPEAPLFFVHGYQSPEYRERAFRELAVRRAPCIIVGTRSALFMPVASPGAIVLDEEHDASFKQDEGLSYQAKEVAWFRARQAAGLLVLGSATPDIKTFYAAEQGELPVSRLPARVGGGSLPAIQMIDIRAANVAESLLAPETRVALKATLERGEQAVILLNRRGYAPLMYCLDCGKVARCLHCDIGMTYHKGRERLVCHYCGHTVPFPAVCPQCKGLHYLPMGQGTERLEEDIAGLLPPGGRVLRLDRDSTRRPGRMEEILDAFARREAQVLVGTQMLSKGHHFPDVTLAVIADGDMGLNLPDYRAAERTFQLLVQSAGRAGRGTRPGQVIIQTRDTHHYCWQFIQNADYDGFFTHEIALREKRRYPPFVRLALIRLSYPVAWGEGPDAVAAVGARLRAAGRARGVTVLGPAPAPLPLLRARRRFQCLLKGSDWNALRAVYADIADAVRGELRAHLDLDPVNML